MIGAALSAGIMILVGRSLDVADSEVFVELATTLTRHSYHVILISAILAGWLMGLLSWRVATPSAKSFSCGFSPSLSGWAICTTVFWEASRFPRACMFQTR